jgi:hypothetical protein
LDIAANAPRLVPLGYFWRLKTRIMVNASLSMKPEEIRAAVDPSHDPAFARNREVLYVTERAVSDWRLPWLIEQAGCDVRRRGARADGVHATVAGRAGDVGFSSVAVLSGARRTGGAARRASYRMLDRAAGIM